VHEHPLAGARRVDLRPKSAPGQSSPGCGAARARRAAGGGTRRCAGAARAHVRPMASAHLAEEAARVHLHHLPVRNVPRGPLLRARRRRQRRPTRDERRRRADDAAIEGARGDPRRARTRRGAPPLPGGGGRGARTASMRSRRSASWMRSSSSCERDAACPISTGSGTRRVRLVRGEGRGVSTQYEEGGGGGPASPRRPRPLRTAPSAPAPASAPPPPAAASSAPRSGATGEGAAPEAPQPNWSKLEAKRVKALSGRSPPQGPAPSAAGPSPEAGPGPLQATRQCVGGGLKAPPPPFLPFSLLLPLPYPPFLLSQKAEAIAGGGEAWSRALAARAKTSRPARGASGLPRVEAVTRPIAGTRAARSGPPRSVRARLRAYGPAVGRTGPTRGAHLLRIFSLILALTSS